MAGPSLIDTIGLLIDGDEFAKVAKVFEGMPDKMQRIAFTQASKRARGVVERDYLRFASKNIAVTQAAIRKRTRSLVSGGVIELVVRSSMIPLHELNPSAVGIDKMQAHASDYGVRIPSRGLYERAFILKAAGKRARDLVMKVDPARKRTKTRSNMKTLYAANPANAVLRKPGGYEGVLLDVAKQSFTKNILSSALWLMTQNKP